MTAARSVKTFGDSRAGMLDAAGLRSIALQLQCIVAQLEDAAMALAAPPREAEIKAAPEVIDKHGASRFCLTARTFLRLAKTGAFPSFVADGRGRVCAYARDVQAYLESRRRSSSNRAQPGQLVDVEELIGRELDKGRLRVVPSGPSAKDRSR